MAAATARVPGAAEAEAAAAASRGTFDGLAEGVAPLDSVAVALGDREAAPVPEALSDFDSPGARAVEEADAIVATGGRVLSVTAVGRDLVEARARAYDAIARISLNGSHHRTDIALLAAEGRVVVPA